MYNVSISLNHAKRKLRRVKYVRLQLEALYSRNMSLQAQIRCMKRVIGDYERMEAARRFNALVQVAAEEDENQILPESIILEEGPST